jgi:hypothetical protein
LLSNFTHPLNELGGAERILHHGGLNSRVESRTIFARQIARREDDDRYRVFAFLNPHDLEPQEIIERDPSGQGASFDEAARGAGPEHTSKLGWRSNGGHDAYPPIVLRKSGARRLSHVGSVESDVTSRPPPPPVRH